MESTNHSGLQCYEHPREEITNFCTNINCLKPLCPDCVEIHTKTHHPQQILSWKHCLSSAAIKIKSTLQELRLLIESHRPNRGQKTIQTIEAENVQQLNMLRDRYHRLIDQVFNQHENSLRTKIRQQYRVDLPDTSKLKVAIDQLQKLLMKMAHPSSTLPALKKALLVDQKALLDFFGHLRNIRPNLPQQNFFSEAGGCFQAIRTSLQRTINLEGQVQGVNPIPSSSVENRFSNFVSVGEWQDPFQPLRIGMNDYFRNDCQLKALHFFIPCSFQLKLFHLEGRQEWQSIQFKAKQELPCYFKSIAIPSGQIYLTGGSDEGRRCRQIFKFDPDRRTLDFVCNMTIQRSSHSICYIDGKIYLIGGFSGPDGDVTRQCQVFDPQRGSCSKISPLNTPSANSAAASFAGQFIFKFGGILNKNEGNSLIEMYSVRNNRWLVVNIETPRGIHLQLLSFSAAAQINDRDILVFGGYDNSQMEKPQRLCYALSAYPQKNSVRVKNFNSTPLVQAEGFWSNNPLIHNKRLYGLQNVTDQQDELTALADDRKVVIFNGERWIT